MKAEYDGRRKTGDLEKGMGDEGVGEKRQVSLDERIQELRREYAGVGVEGAVLEVPPGVANVERGKRQTVETQEGRESPRLGTLPPKRKRTMKDVR